MKHSQNEMMKYIIHTTLWTWISTLDDITNVQKGNSILDQSHKMSQHRYCLEMLIALKYPNVWELEMRTCLKMNHTTIRLLAKWNWDIMLWNENVLQVLWNVVCNLILVNFMCHFN